LFFSNPILEADKILSLYKKSDFSYQIESDYLKETYSLYLRKILDRKEIGKLKLLDIGCGNGFFLEKARSLGIKEVYGVEPSKPAVRKAPKWLQGRIKIDVLHKDLFRNSFFDVICCFHTLDHVVDPNFFLKETFNLLKNGGEALFIVHDTGGLSVRVLGERSPIFDIEHIYLFNKNTLAKIFKKNGFKVVEVFEVQNTYPFFYWYRMFPLPNLIKRFGLKVLEYTKIGFIPISLKAGNIGIVAKKL